MSWDPSLVYQETSAISDEARGFLDKSLFGTGQNNLGPSAGDYGDLTFWAPTVNMDRDPRWGRTDEAFGEDPYLVGQMAGAYVDGYQGETITGRAQSPYLKVAATAKHYALNDVENDRTRHLLERLGQRTARLLHQAVRRPDRERARLGPDDLLQRDQRHPVGRRHLHRERTGAAHLRLRRLHHLRLRRGGHHLRTAPGGHDWAPTGWSTDGKGANGVWTNTVDRRHRPGARGRAGVRAARRHPAQLRGRREHPGQHPGRHRGRGAERRGDRRRAGAPVHAAHADRRVRPALEGGLHRHHESRDPEPRAPGAGHAGRRQLPGAAQELRTCPAPAPRCCRSKPPPRTRS